MKNKSEGIQPHATEADGHAELISIIETKVKAKSPKEKKLQEKLDHFLFALRDRAQSYR
jgi:hypothetical protein